MNLPKPKSKRKLRKPLKDYDSLSRQAKFQRDNIANGCCAFHRDAPLGHGSKRYCEACLEKFRRRAAEDRRTRGAKELRCGNCGAMGHTIRICPNPPTRGVMDIPPVGSFFNPAAIPGKRKKKRAAKK